MEKCPGGSYIPPSKQKQNRLGHSREHWAITELTKVIDYVWNIGADKVLPVRKMQNGNRKQEMDAPA